MLHHITNHIKTKSGAASLYAVIFATLVIGIVTLSFVRIMISESQRTINTDLNQSAYDSALAGVEDVKTALIKARSLGGDERAELFGDQCNRIADYLYGTRGSGQYENQDIQISESQGAGGTESQAYTCVKVDNAVLDYKATLTDSTRIKVIPLRLKGGFSTATKLKISWYKHEEDRSDDPINWLYEVPTPSEKENPQPLNFGQYGVTTVDSDKGREAPTVLSASLIQTDKTFAKDDLIADASETGTDRSTLVLYPVQANGQEIIKKDAVRQAAQPDSTNQAFYVNCKKAGTYSGQNFACSAEIELPPALHGTDKNDFTAFLIIAAPYGTSNTPFSVTAYGNDDQPMDFLDVQYKVDSTGRANDIYRRIETRLELGDANFPYPEYVAELSNNNDDDSSSIWKNFWVTRNCQKTTGEKWGEDYNVTECKNSDRLTDQPQSK